MSVSVASKLHEFCLGICSELAMKSIIILQTCLFEIMDTYASKYDTKNCIKYLVARIPGEQNGMALFSPLSIIVTQITHRQTNV